MKSWKSSSAAKLFSYWWFTSYPYLRPMAVQPTNGNGDTQPHMPYCVRGSSARPAKQGAGPATQVASAARCADSLGAGTPCPPLL